MHRNITDLGVLDVTPEGLALVETAPGVTYDEITEKTAAPVHTHRGTNSPPGRDGLAPQRVRNSDSPVRSRSTSSVLL